MTSMARVNVAAREAAGQIEHRFGRKRVLIFGAAIGLIALLLFMRFVTVLPIILPKRGGAPHFVHHFIPSFIARLCRNLCRSLCPSLVGQARRFEVQGSRLFPSPRIL